MSAHIIFSLSMFPSALTARKDVIDQQPAGKYADCGIPSQTAENLPTELRLQSCLVSGMSATSDKLCKLFVGRSQFNPEWNQKSGFPSVHKQFFVCVMENTSDIVRLKLTFIFFLAVNLLAIVILCRGKCGLSKCITRYLVAMAITDLMGVISGVIFDRMNNIYVFARLLLITPVCAVTLVFRLATMNCSVWLTVAFTFDRCVAICSQKLRERYCTERTATIMVLIVGTGNCVRCVAFYFAVEPSAIIDNVPWRCIVRADYFTSPVWKAYQMFNTIITPLLSFALILLFNVLTVRNIIAANRVRRGLRNSNVNKKDSEVENRRESMILLFALSANFISLWIPFIASTMIRQSQNFFCTDRYLNSPSFILQEFGFMLQFLCTCTNTCIYTRCQRKFREEIKTGVKHLVTLNGRLCTENVS
ncbi:probable G-protein coupled receptor 139 [Mobula hypostoma]|uniref:probable G-protein coupled receptor 139 n=1 Tax=Mobula hypostoma TaxID=723540 RepID=UPI002FC2C1C1